MALRKTPGNAWAILLFLHMKLVTSQVFSPTTHSRRVRNKRQSRRKLYYDFGTEFVAGFWKTVPNQTFVIS